MQTEGRQAKMVYVLQVEGSQADTDVIQVKDGQADTGVKQAESSQLATGMRKTVK